MNNMNPTDAPRRSRLATASLALAMFCALFELLPLLLALVDEPAHFRVRWLDSMMEFSFFMVPGSVVAGVLAGVGLVRIRRSRGRQVGGAWATAALVLLLISNALFIAFWVILASNFRMW